MSSTKYKTVVTGATGFLGHHLMPVLLKKYGVDHVVGLSSKDYNLMDPIQIHRMFEECKPEILIHLAAYSGGIGANSEFPADFFHRNILLMALVFRKAAEYGVKKLVFPIGGCSYPATATSPIDEGQMWNGYPQRESVGYAMAKKMGIVASNCYRRQFGLNSVIIIPGNMYGEYDNFKIDESHVIPAMIRRFFEAKRARSKKVVIWGTGSPVRDFVYAGDVAEVFPFFIESYSISEPVNISSGTTTSIKELAETIKELIGYEGEIAWDSSKPDGQMVKIFDVTKMKSFGLSCSTALEEGLKRTIAWLEKNYDKRSDGIRL
jgi:GDP-L-fucose synthase